VNKKDLARRLAKEAHRSQAQAADEVDALIHRLLTGAKKNAHAPKRQANASPDQARSKDQS